MFKTHISVELYFSLGFLSKRPNEELKSSNFDGESKFRYKIIMHTFVFYKFSHLRLLSLKMYTNLSFISENTFFVVLYLAYFAIAATRITKPRPKTD